MENQIYYNPNGDTRTLDHVPSYDEVLDAIETHQTNMRTVLRSVGDLFYDKSEVHDESVMDHFEDYYDSVVKTMVEDTKFNGTKWYGEHYLDEAYHRNKMIPEESNLFDMIEGLCDQVVVSKERRIDKGQVLTKDEVYNMYLNTIELLEDSMNIVL